MNNYIGSEYHKENLRKVSELGREVLAEKKQERISEYLLNPNKCYNCDEIIPYESKHKKFCNSSCSASFNNKKRKISEEQKIKTSISVKKYFQKETLLHKEERLTNLTIANRINANDTIYPYTKIKSLNCKICNNIFFCKSSSIRKTCSKKCQVHASVGIRTYQNGTRKPQKYFNKWINKEIWLDSSWEKEIADLLDNLNIRWERPNPISWFDANNTERFYYPDFFLNDYGVFLDPKNPFCMEKDKEKMNFVEKIINIIYGDKQIIKDKIEKLWKSIKVT